MPDLAELLASLDAAFVERMKAVTEGATAKSKELSDQSEALMGTFVQKYSDLLKNPVKIEPIDERSGTPADSPEAAKND